MKKQLEIGTDYGFVFSGICKDKGQHMIYNGGISFTAKNGAVERTLENQATYDKIEEYINRPVVRMGNMA
jgi:hypothetical protein